MAGFIYSDIILPNANEQYALLQKSWNVVSKALTWGSCPVYTPIVKRGNYFGTDMTVPYIKDVFLERGKLSDSDSNVIYMRSWYQPNDIDYIIDKEKKLAKSAAERGEKYESSWNLEVLESLKDKVTQKPNDAQTDSEKKRNIQTSGVEIIHAFQRGVGQKFYSFHVATGQIVRTKTNLDPRGELPIQYMYADTDGANPLGRGFVELVAPIQNLIDAEVQMYQFNRALMLAPPMVKRGGWNANQAKLVPNILVDLGSEPSASWEPIKIDSSALQSFPNNYGLMKSQLLNLLSSPDTSISSEIGNPGFSKTPAGVNAQQANVSVDDNFVRKQFETFFERWSETAINLYFAEHTGVEDIQVDKKTAQSLRKIDPSLVNEENIVRMDFESATPALKFEVDASTSKMKDDASQLEALDGLLERLERSQVLQSIIPQEKIVGAWNSIVAASGVENPEELSLSDEELQQIQQEQAAQAEAEAQAQAEAQQQQAAEKQQMAQLEAQAAMPAETLEQPGEPMEAPGQPEQPGEPADPQYSEEDLSFAADLFDMGLSEEKVAQALEMDRAGVPNEEILAMLGAE